MDLPKAIISLPTDIVNRFKTGVAFSVALLRAGLVFLNAF
jgi:hypothetical protein